MAQRQAFNLMAYETKFSALNLKKVQQNGEFEGYASLFSKEDMGRDVVMPGAFADSLKRRGTGGIRMLFQHDPNEVIGVWEKIYEDRRGLFVQGRLASGVARAREILDLMQAGALDGLSIGFRTVKGRSNNRTGVRHLHKIDLWEISVVTFPMLAGARISAVKRQPFAGKMPTEREFERWLTRDAGFTRSQARALMGAGFKAFAATRDAAGRCNALNLRTQNERLIGAMRQAAQTFYATQVR